MDAGSRTSRVRPRGERVLGAIALALLGAAVLSGAVATPASSTAAAATAAGASTASAEAEGVTVVDIPYRSEIDVTPAEGWTIADCGAITPPPGVTIACEASTLTFSAPEYDAELERSDVPVLLTTGTTTLTVVYRVGLAPPEPPRAESITYPVPFAQGTRALVPIADLGIECTVCTADGGQRIEAVGVSPKRAGTIAVSATHLVFAAAPDFTGDAKLRYRVTDDLGQSSETTTVIASVYPSGPSSLVALHTVVEAERDGTTTIDLAGLVASSGSDGDVTIERCGSAITGVAVCREDGTAEFRSAGVPVDQFSFHVVSPDGEHATGSVTIVEPGLASAPLPGVIAADGVGESRVIVPARPPVEEERGNDRHALDPLVALLDRLTG